LAILQAGHDLIDACDARFAVFPRHQRPVLQLAADLE
jgi:hypothetical protein